MKLREPSIEVLRCAMMFVIVLGHMSAMGPYSGNPFVHGVFSLSYFATDAFVFISGWYGISLKGKKIIGLLGCGLFAALVNLALSKIAIGQWCFRYSLGWFGNSYFALMLMSPLINAGIDKARADGILNRTWMALTIACLLSWIPLGESIRLAPAGWYGNSTLALVYVYITGRVAAQSDILSRLSIQRVTLFVIAMICVNVLWAALALYSHGNAALASIFVESRCNNSPITIALAFSVFLFFRHVRFPHWIESAASFIAPSVLSIYLLHIGCNESVGKALFAKYAFIPASSQMLQMTSFAFAAIIVFSSCLAFDLCRRFILQCARSLKK